MKTLAQRKALDEVFREIEHEQADLSRQPKPSLPARIAAFFAPLKQRSPERTAVYLYIPVVVCAIVGAIEIGRAVFGWLFAGAQ